MREIDLLYRLQEINDGISQRRTAKENLIESLISKKNQYSELSNEIARAEQEFGKLSREFKKLELDAKSVESRLNNEEKKISIVRNPKEYDSLMHSIAAIKEKMDDLETTELELMEKLEENETKIKSLKEKKNSDFQALRDYSGRCKEDIENLESEIADFIDEKNDIKPRITRVFLDHYEKLVEMNGCGIATVDTSAICGNCSLGILPNQIRTISSGSAQLVKCSNCERYLYWTGPVDE